MEIIRELAENIVEEMKKIIGKDINYISIDGEIIASTDKKRIGTYHLGAKEVVRTQKIVFIEKDDEYLGAKKGVNLPVKFDNRTIGVIGISGETKEVEKYGQIIKKMTEILIKEAYVKEKEEIEIEYEKILLEHLLLDKNIVEKSLIVSSAIEEMAVNENGIVVSIKLENIKSMDRTKKCFEIIKKIVKNQKGYLMLSKGIVTILFFEKTRKKIKEVLETIKKNLNLHENIELSCGIGRNKKNIRELESSYFESITALEWSIKNNKSIFFYEDMKLEIILNSVDKEIKQTYIEELFKNLDFKEIEEFKEIFISYEKNNGSIEKIAQELFIHKNTLQYRINRFKEKSGLDIRKYSDFTMLKIGYMIIFGL